jgi:hypothetical protein
MKCLRNMTRKIMQIIESLNFIELFTCHKIFVCSETFTESCDKIEDWF